METTVGSGFEQDNLTGGSTTFAEFVLDATAWRAVDEQHPLKCAETGMAEAVVPQVPDANYLGCHPATCLRQQRLRQFLLDPTVVSILFSVIPII